ATPAGRANVSPVRIVWASKCCRRKVFIGVFELGVFESKADIGWAFAADDGRVALCRGEAQVSRGRTVSRRQFGMTAAAAAAASVLPQAALLAQTAAPNVSANPWAQLGTMAARARQLGLTTPRMSLGLTGGTAYNDTMPAVVDFIDHIKSSAVAA